jgi:plastocyanin
MANLSRVVLLSACASLVSLHAADITGTVIVERRLTRRNVTPRSPAYSRGVAVDLSSEKSPPSEALDPLSFERTHVVVYIEGKGPVDKPVTAEIEQKDRQFSPDLVVAPVGSTISFPNMDAIFHNVFSLSKPKSFDLGNYSKGQTRTETFPVPGVVFVYCHLHTNMSATIVITPNQWSAKPDAAGNFKLPNIPPGKYTIIAWHKTAGTFRQTVVVSGDQPPAIKFLIPFTDDQAPSSVAKR